jgi:hypothetical protein
MTKILVDAGCAGNDGHYDQPWDLGPLAGPNIVWRRSFPHDKKWPDLAEMVDRLREAHYGVQAVVTVRDPWAMVRSQVNAGHVLSERVAWANVEKAYRLIYGQLAALDLPALTVPYEALVARPAPVQQRLAQRLELPLTPAVNVIDANQKWYEEG